MKIAIFSGTIPSTSFIERLVEGVSQHHQVFLFGTQEKATQYASSQIQVYATPRSKFRNVCVSLLRSIRLVLKRPKSFSLLVKEIRKENTRYARFSKYTKYLPIVLYRPDILHIQWAKDLPEYAFFKTAFNIKLIVSFRGAHINYTPIVEPKYVEKYTKSFTYVDAFHGVSEAIVKKASQYGDIKVRSQVIYSPIPNTFVYAYKPFKRREDNTLKLLSVGRNHWKKGYQYAIEALAILKENGCNVTYTIIGVQKPSEALMFQIHELGLSENIIFLEKFTQNQLVKAYTTYDVLLLPSLVEGIANVVLEAMAVGLPVISTDCGGMAEVVIYKKTGWLVPMRDASAIANAVMDLEKTSNTDLQTLVDNAHLLVKHQFNYEENISKFIDLYTSVVKQ